MKPITLVRQRLEQSGCACDGYDYFECPSCKTVGEFSLHVTKSDNGEVVLRCCRACSRDDVLLALKLSTTDLEAKGNEKPTGNLTREEYADALKIPWDDLCSYGLSGLNISAYGPVVKIPYWEHDRSSKPIAVRFRLNMEGDDRFVWRKGDRACLYGTWKLWLAREKGYVVIVEGESDCHVLWHHEIPAVGVPGTKTWKHDWASYLEEIPTVYVVAEPDEAGRMFVEDLASSPLGPRLQVIDLSPFKDPRALHLQDPSSFTDAWEAARELGLAWPRYRSREEKRAQRRQQARVREALDRLEEDVRGGGKTAVADILDDPARVNVLADAAETDPAAWSASLLKLEGHNIPQRIIKTLRDAVDRIAAERRDRESQSRATAPADGGGREPRVVDVVPNAPVPKDVVVPAGWKLKSTYTGERILDDGKETVVPFIASPVLINGRFRDDATGKESVRLAFRMDGEWRSLIVDRTQVADIRKIVQLADDGLLVHSDNSRSLMRYLAALETANRDSLPRAHVTERLGWQAGNRGFLLGETLYLPGGGKLNTSHLASEVELPRDAVVFRARDAGPAQVARAFHRRGDREEWRQIISNVADQPQVRFALYASLAAPLLEVLDLPNFVVSLSGETSRGKTATLYLAASPWGNPAIESSASVVGTWKATPAGIEGVAGMLNGLPLFLDDSKEAPTPQLVPDVIYGFTSGQFRRRGNIHSFRAVASARGVLLSSGEQPLSGFGRHGGGRARVLELFGSPFDGTDLGQFVTELKEGVCGNYGHAGPEFIAFLLGNKESWPIWREEVEERRRQYRMSAGSGAVAGRLAESLAAVAAASSLAHEANLFPFPHEDVIDPLFDRLVGEGGEAADLASEALRSVLNWVRMNPARFAGNQDHGDFLAGRERGRPDLLRRRQVRRAGPGHTTGAAARA